jgi:hypothetical protein
MNMHKGRQLGRGVQCLLHQLHAQLAPAACHDQCAHGAHRAAFGGRGHTQEDGAQHQEDQDQRRDQHKGDLLRQLGQQAELQELVHQGQHQGQDGGHGQRHDEGLVARRRRHAAGQAVDHAFVHLRPHVAGRTADDEQHQQRTVATGAIAFAVDAGFGRQCGHPTGLHDGHHGHEQQVAAHQQQARQHGPGVHVAHRAAQLVGQHDQHQRRRNGLRQRAAGRDGAGGDGAVVAVAQHDGQRDQAHADDGRSHHAGGGRQQRADQDHRHGQAAAQWAEDLAHGFEQVLGHPGSLQDDAHEGEERNRQQGVVLHDAEHTQRQGTEHIGREQPGFDADEAHEQARGRQAKGHRDAGEQEAEQRHEHQWHKVGGDEFDHVSALRLLFVQPWRPVLRPATARPSWRWDRD